MIATDIHHTKCMQKPLSKLLDHILADKITTVCQQIITITSLSIAYLHKSFITNKICYTLMNIIQQHYAKIKNHNKEPTNETQ